MGWHSRYIGLPFKDEGRDFNGIDCWGMPFLAFWHERGIRLPEYNDISAFDVAAIALKIKEESALDPWLPVDQSAELRDFDVAVMLRHREPRHIGVIVGKSDLLHIEKMTDSVLVSLDHPSVKQRPKLFFRHRDMT